MIRPRPEIQDLLRANGFQDAGRGWGQLAYMSWRRVGAYTVAVYVYLPSRDEWQFRLDGHAGGRRTWIQTVGEVRDYEDAYSSESNQRIDLAEFQKLLAKTLVMQDMEEAPKPLSGFASPGINLTGTPIEHASEFTALHSGYDFHARRCDEALSTRDCRTASHHYQEALTSYGILVTHAEGAGYLQRREALKMYTEMLKLRQRFEDACVKFEESPDPVDVMLTKMMRRSNRRETREEVERDVVSLDRMRKLKKERERLEGVGTVPTDADWAGLERSSLSGGGLGAAPSGWGRNGRQYMQRALKQAGMQNDGRNLNLWWRESGHPGGTFAKGNFQLIVEFDDKAGPSSLRRFPKEVSDYAFHVRRTIAPSWYFYLFRVNRDFAPSDRDTILYKAEYASGAEKVIAALQHSLVKWDEVESGLAGLSTTSSVTYNLEPEQATTTKASSVEQVTTPRLP